MCDYLNKTGATYYFRRAVPDDLIGVFRTQRGNARAEWKISLATKDREDAKRLRLAHIVQTDEWIDDARRDAAITSEVSPVVSTAREQGELDAAAALEAASDARRASRRELRTLWRQRRQTSTAMLTPEEAAAVDLIRERDAENDKLRDAIATLEAGNQVLGIPAPLRRSREPKAVISISGLFERYAALGSGLTSGDRLRLLGRSTG